MSIEALIDSFFFRRLVLERQTFFLQWPRCTAIRSRSSEPKARDNFESENKKLIFEKVNPNETIVESFPIFGLRFVEAAGAGELS